MSRGIRSKKRYARGSVASIPGITGVHTGIPG